MSYVSDSYVMNIRGLMLNKNSDLEAIAKCVDEYIEVIPDLSEDIKESLNTNRMNIFSSSVKRAVNMLNSVYAKWLQNDGENILRAAVKEDIDMCRKNIPPFAANLLSLSIGMQTAKNNYLNNENVGVNQNTIEFFSDVLKNLYIVEDFINKSQHAHAASILIDMAIPDHDGTVGKLITSLKSGKESAGLFNTLINNYNEKIALIWKGKAEDKKIMLVDDRPEILETVGGYLRDKYKIYALTGGTIALKVLEKQKPDLFILDIDMPDMDGITLTGMIRRLTGFGTTPIIILTSNATKEYVLGAMQAGANDFVIKPPNKETLTAKVATFLL